MSIKKDNKIALILISFLIVFILTFIFLGGLEAVIELLSILVEKSEVAVKNLIDLIEKFLNIFNLNLR